MPLDLAVETNPVGELLRRVYWPASFFSEVIAAIGSNEIEVLGLPDTRVIGKMKALSVWLLALLILSGCEVPVLPITEMYGNWRADYSFGWQVLELRADGTYQQTVTINGKSGDVKHSGKWHYDTKLGSVFYQDCLLVINGFGEMRSDFAVPVAGACVIPVERRFLFVGGVRMGSQEGNLFIRQP